MKNPGIAKRFVKNLVDNLCDFAQEQGKLDAYAERLSGYSLTPDQWQKVLNILIARQTQRGLPLLSEIHAAISDVQTPARHEAASRKGQMVFRLNGVEYVLIVRLESSVSSGEYWAIASVPKKRGGETVEAQKHIGMEATARLSLIPGAELVGFYPDDSNLIWRHETCAA
jgi:hypothetical protein